jgi:hypothetical protein
VGGESFGGFLDGSPSVKRKRVIDVIKAAKIGVLENV